jgi:hypothetical protein
MKLASISEIKNELNQIPSKDLLEICLRLARYKKENKELLTYLLFESHDLQQYILQVKNEIELQFEEVNRMNLYFAKKTIRKILRITNKYIRHTGSKEAEAEILLHFCVTLKNSGIEFKKSPALNNLYLSQLKKIQAAIDSLHEDLRYDYQKQADKLA